MQDKLHVHTGQQAKVGLTNSQFLCQTASSLLVYLVSHPHLNALAAHSAIKPATGSPLQPCCFDVYVDVHPEHKPEAGQASNVLTGSAGPIGIVPPPTTPMAFIGKVRVVQQFAGVP